MKYLLTVLAMVLVCTMAFSQQMSNNFDSKLGIGLKIDRVFYPPMEFIPTTGVGATPDSYRTKALNIGLELSILKFKRIYKLGLEFGYLPRSFDVANFSLNLNNGQIPYQSAPAITFIKYAEQFISFNLGIGIEKIIRNIYLDAAVQVNLRYYGNYSEGYHFKSFYADTNNTWNTSLEYEFYGPPITLSLLFGPTLSMGQNIGRFFWALNMQYMFEVSNPFYGTYSVLPQSSHATSGSVEINDCSSSFGVKFGFHLGKH
jgi:hypothetical protein